MHSSSSNFTNKDDELLIKNPVFINKILEDGLGDLGHQQNKTHKAAFWKPTLPTLQEEDKKDEIKIEKKR